MSLRGTPGVEETVASRVSSESCSSVGGRSVEGRGKEEGELAELNLNDLGENRVGPEAESVRATKPRP